MGGESCWGNLYNAFTEILKTYAFMICIEYRTNKNTWGNYSLDTGDLGTTAYLESVDSSTLTFENDKVTVETLYEEMSQEQMLAIWGMRRSRELYPINRRKNFPSSGRA
ncbi:MAG: hypothetical protein ACLRSW_06675 [Christensenellaceae bacterium]